MRIILASASPRRKEILGKLKIPFEVVISNADENIGEKDPETLVKKLALLKADDVFKNEEADSAETTIVIGADTVVDVDGKILGKPADKAAARDMLQTISGKKHKVHTGIAVIVKTADGQVNTYSDVVTSGVCVSPLTPREIEDYIATGEPFDKAGSYALQGLFAPYIESIEGDYYNIVGLPINALYKILAPILNKFGK